MNKRRFIQYNLWKNCNNGCEFCFNRGCHRASTEEMKEILQFVTQKLKSSETDSYDEIGFIGGEIFDDQLDDVTVKKMFYDMFMICKDKIKARKLKKICIATSLVFDITKHLIPFVDFISSIGIEPYVLFCTSYDIKYRFHTNEALKLWEQNMIKLGSLSTNQVHTEMIVTQFLIDAIFAQKFDLTSFSHEFNTSIDFIEPTFIDFFKSRFDSIQALPDFFPKRSSFLHFLQILAIQKGVIDIDRFLSIQLRSDTSYYKLESGEWIKIDNRWENGIRRIGKDGNFKQIFSYSDSDASMTDDVLFIAGKQ